MNIFEADGPHIGEYTIELTARELADIAEMCSVYRYAISNGFVPGYGSAAVARRTAVALSIEGVNLERIEGAV